MGWHRPTAGKFLSASNLGVGIRSKSLPFIVGAVFAPTLLLPPSAWAGRPQSTDDAATADAGTCQLEGWTERNSRTRAHVLAAACSPAPGVEIDLDHTWLRPVNLIRAEAGLALKWVPSAWRFETGTGELNFGLKFNIGFQQPSTGWQRAGHGVLGLASLKVSDAMSVHGNLGFAVDRNSGQSARLLNLAVVWSPIDAALLFAELQNNSKPAVFGGTTRGQGARWWLVKDSLGLDLTARRESGSGSGTQWGLGFGWYGLTF